MKLPLRIAILESDTPLTNTKSKYGGYAGVFQTLLKSGAKLLPSSSLDGIDVTGWSVQGDNDSDNEKWKKIFTFTKHDVVNDLDDYPDLNGVDGVLITGSRHDSFADIPWVNKLVEFTQKILAQDRVRLIGVCFGHQIIGRASGVKVGRNTEWEAAVHEVQLTEKGKELFGVNTLNIHQMHRDIVFHWPKGVEKLGSSPVCEVQGMYQADRLLTVQGHPEFTQDIVTEILETRHATGVFSEDAFNTHIKKVALPHDGVNVGRAFLQFLLD